MEQDYVRPRIDPDLQQAWDMNLSLKEQLEDKLTCLAEIRRLLTLPYLDTRELKTVLTECLGGNY